MKRVFGKIEAAFDIFYLVAALIIGIVLLATPSSTYESGVMESSISVRLLAGIMALVLVVGDAFHLVPRITVILKDNEEKYRKQLGRGKQITSITMTIFYILLWIIGLKIYSPSDINIWSYAVYALAAVRIILCLFPGNRWLDRYPPVKWGIYRNIPFFIQGMIVAGLFFINRSAIYEFRHMYLAIVLSFLFYLPVVIWANKNPKVGMFMLPKTIMYLWILVMCLSL